MCWLQAVLFFWASWSAPCKHMQQVLETLAKQHQGITYLQVRMQLQGSCSEESLFFDCLAPLTT